MPNFRVAVSLALSTIVLSGCVTETESAWSPPPRPPAPTAIEGEPPITTQRSLYDTYDLYFQRFEDSGVYRVGKTDASIAERYRVFGGRKQDVAAQVVRANCPIADMGVVLLRSCRGDGEMTEEQEIALALTRPHGEDIFPRYRALPEGRDTLNRTVSLRLAMPAIPAPDVDLTSGREVDQQIVDIRRIFRRVSESYPSRALRQELEGDMTARCQIQQDLSVICQPVSFEPSEHFAIFERSFISGTRYAVAPPQLLDGSDARGVRFELTLAWRLN